MFPVGIVMKTWRLISPCEWSGIRKSFFWCAATSGLPIRAGVLAKVAGAVAPGRRHLCNVLLHEEFEVEHDAKVPNHVLRMDDASADSHGAGNYHCHRPSMVESNMTIHLAAGRVETQDCTTTRIQHWKTYDECKIYCKYRSLLIHQLASIYMQKTVKKSMTIIIIIIIIIIRCCFLSRDHCTRSDSTASGMFDQFWTS